METKAQGQTIEHSISLAMPQQSTVDTNLVDVVINYPKDWDKKKFFTDGDVKTVAKETAQQFIDMGIASYKSDAKIDDATETKAKKAKK